MIIISYKPGGISSNEFCQYIKQKYNIRKIGHSGTLDIFASGLMIMGINNGTKLLPNFTKSNKTYIFTIIWGIETNTEDTYGNIMFIDKKNINKTITKKNVINAIKNIKKIKTQYIPICSAKKIKGERLYQSFFKNKEYINKFSQQLLKNVKILTIKLIIHNQFSSIIKCKTEGGFYIRSLARDIGKFISTYSTAIHIFRTNIGKYSLCNLNPMEFKILNT